MQLRGDGLDRTSGRFSLEWRGARRGLFDLKGVVERVTEVLRVDCSLIASGLPGYLVRGRGAVLETDGRRLGVVGLLPPAVTAGAGLPKDEEVYVAEVDLDARQPRTTPLRVQHLPRHPSVVRDISIIVDNTLSAETVRGTIRSAASDILGSVSEFDRYRGKGVPEDRVSLSLRLTFRAPDRTLTDTEVTAAVDRTLAALKSAYNAVQR